MGKNKIIIKLFFILLIVCLIVTMNAKDTLAENMGGGDGNEEAGKIEKSQDDETPQQHNPPSESRSTSRNRTYTGKTSNTLDDYIDDANKFTSEGEESMSIDTNMLKNISGSMYNILLGIGSIIAVLVGVILGIKYMVGSIDEKADLKGVLVTYVVGCVVIFGAFGIWRLVVNILAVFK